MRRVKVDNGMIAFEDFGSGDPILIIHGMLDTGGTHARLALALSRNFRVLLPDLRGYGQSRPPLRTFPPDFYQRDTADMVCLLQDQGVTSVRVIGIADGAEVALLLALALPTVVKSVIAVSVTGALPPELLGILDKLGSWAEEVDLSHLSWRSDAIRTYGLEGLRSIWCEWRAAARAIIAAGGNISLAEAGSIQCPVLVFNGENDKVNSYAMTQALAAAIPQSTLYLVADADQEVYTTNRELFLQVVVEWFIAH